MSYTWEPLETTGQLSQEVTVLSTVSWSNSREGVRKPSMV